MLALGFANSFFPQCCCPGPSLCEGLFPSTDSAWECLRGSSCRGRLCCSCAVAISPKAPHRLNRAHSQRLWGLLRESQDILPWGCGVALAYVWGGCRGESFLLQLSLEGHPGMGSGGPSPHPWATLVPGGTRGAGVWAEPSAPTPSSGLTHALSPETHSPPLQASGLTLVWPEFIFFCPGLPGGVGPNPRDQAEAGVGKAESGRLVGGTDLMGSMWPCLAHATFLLPSMAVPRARPCIHGCLLTS